MGHGSDPLGCRARARGAPDGFSPGFFRAATGYLGVPRNLPERVRFIDPPFPAFEWRNGWKIICCPTPYIATPAATIGLGDTFLAGTLLVLSASTLASSIDRDPIKSAFEP